MFKFDRIDLMFLVLMVSAFVFILSSCSSITGGIAKPVADLAKTAIKTGGAIKLADTANKTVKTVSDNKTKRQLAKTDVLESEIKKDENVNNAFEKAIMGLPVEERVPLIREGLKLKGKDIDKDIAIAEFNYRNANNEGKIMAFIVFISLWFVYIIINRLLRKTKKVTKDY